MHAISDTYGQNYKMSITNSSVRRDFVANWAHSMGP